MCAACRRGWHHECWGCGCECNRDDDETLTAPESITQFEHEESMTVDEIIAYRRDRGLPL